MDRVGQGTYGVVFKGKNKETGEIVAMKKIKLESDEEGIPTSAIREISVLKRMRHPNVVGLKDIVLEEHKLYLIFEFLTMDLRKFLESLPKNSKMDNHLVKSYTFQIFEGLAYCHGKRILHRDMKPANLLIGSNGLLKLADFGLARAFGIPVKVCTREVVTLWYRAPEILLGSSKYSCPIDIWSVGTIFAEMIKLRPIFCGDTELNQLYKIFEVLTTPTDIVWPEMSDLPEYKDSFPRWTRNTLETTMGDCDPLAVDLLAKCFQYDPNRRIDALNALQHPYFHDVRMITPVVEDNAMNV